MSRANADDILAAISTICAWCMRYCASHEVGWTHIGPRGLAIIFGALLVMEIIGDAVSSILFVMLAPWLGLWLLKRAANNFVDGVRARCPPRPPTGSRKP